MFSELLERAVGIVWYYPVVLLCLFTGIYFTFVKMRFVQFRCFRHAMELIRGNYDNPNEHGQITHFQALAAALSGTIGLGNIAGVSIAIALGGPGAIFWMWIVGIFGMATKFVECTLGTLYRDEDQKTGEVRGGPMYYIAKGMGKKWQPLAMMYAVCAVFGALGAGGMFQSNQAASALLSYYNIPVEYTGIILASMVAIVIIGGIKRIGNVASKIVPSMCGIYVFGALLICALNYDKLPYVIAIIFQDAFTGTAAAGGSIGAVLRWGVRRAIFSNEAGLGSASIAHAAVKTNYPVREGIVASLGPLIDTIVVCTATAAIIIMGGNFGAGMYQQLTPIPESTATLSKNWHIQTDNIPKITNKLRNVREGNSVLSFNSTLHDENTILRVPVTTKKGENLRFSYYKTNGNMAVRLRNKQNTPLTVTVFGVNNNQNFTASDNEEPLLKADGCTQEKAWQSCVLSGKLLKESFDGHLEFIPIGNTVNWQIDNIATVKKYEGIALTIVSFDQFLAGFGSIFISFAVFLFAFSTMISWSYYGETSMMYIVGVFHGDKNSISPFSKQASLFFKWVFVSIIYVGAINSLSNVINFSDLMLGLMVIPNTIAILYLSNEVKALTSDYFSQLKEGKFPKYK